MPHSSRTAPREGFTLIELLIVVVIIGILAAIAIPKFARTKEQAYVATMKSDLRNLVTAEEGYFADALAFTSDLTAVGLSPSKNVTIVVSIVTGGGWQANATHVNAPTRTCDVYVGNAATAAGQTEGVPVCK